VCAGRDARATAGEDAGGPLCFPLAVPVHSAELPFTNAEVLAGNIDALPREENWLQPSLFFLHRNIDDVPR
jgi:hypothetical protein